jgi:hypothetical protein
MQKTKKRSQQIQQHIQRIHMHMQKVNKKMELQPRVNLSISGKYENILEGIKKLKELELSVKHLEISETDL